MTLQESWSLSIRILSINVHLILNSKLDTNYYLWIYICSWVTHGYIFANKFFNIANRLLFKNIDTYINLALPINNYGSQINNNIIISNNNNIIDNIITLLLLIIININI